MINTISTLVKFLRFFQILLFLDFEFHLKFQVLSFVDFFLRWEKDEVNFLIPKVDVQLGFFLQPIPQFPLVTAPPQKPHPVFHVSDTLKNWIWKLEEKNQEHEFVVEEMRKLVQNLETELEEA